jgi:hypothetical protein
VFILNTIQLKKKKKERRKRMGIRKNLKIKQANRIIQMGIKRKFK